MTLNQRSDLTLGVRQREIPESDHIYHLDFTLNHNAALGQLREERLRLETRFW